MSMFTTDAHTVIAGGRYTLDSGKPTAEGTVHQAIGTAGQNKGQGFLVHVPKGRGVESISMHAVASAVVHGAVPLADIVAAFVAEGRAVELRDLVLSAVPLPADEPAAEPEALTALVDAAAAAKAEPVKSTTKAAASK